MNQFGLHSAFEKRRSLKFSTRATAGDHRHVRISFDYKKAEIFLLAPLPHHTPIPTEFSTNNKDWSIVTLKLSSVFRHYSFLSLSFLMTRMISLYTNVEPYLTKVPQNPNNLWLFTSFLRLIIQWTPPFNLWLKTLIQFYSFSLFQALYSSVTDSSVYSPGTSRSRPEVLPYALV